LIYIESTLPGLSWLKSNIIDKEIIDDYAKDSILIKTNEKDKNDDDDDYNQSLLNRQRYSELSKLLDILNMLSTQAKQVLEKEIYLERILNKLLATRKAHVSMID
jgi:hypothetical protein